MKSSPSPKCPHAAVPKGMYLLLFLEKKKNKFHDIYGKITYYATTKSTLLHPVFAFRYFFVSVNNYK